MRKVISISLALLTLALSLNLGFAFHFCGGKLAQTKLLGYGKADCGMENNRQECKKHSPAETNRSSSKINKIPCCENEFQKISSDDYLSLKILSKSIVEAIPVFQSIFSFFENSIQLFHTVLYRPPPNLTSVFLPFIQSFII